ncbi:MAG: ankyrin repeat domain-containing protein, partial [Mesotoga sp.]|nr:ankyrin repeat domain-containing protein [Mesotoga sp.]
DLLGMTTAHYAVQDKWDGIEMLKILRQFGVPVNIKDNSGKMPEDYAASEEIKEFLRSLY